MLLIYFVGIILVNCNALENQQTKHSYQYSLETKYFEFKTLWKLNKMLIKWDEPNQAQFFH